jgi:hypothetical protein
MRSARQLAWFAIASQLVFIATWLVAGALEDGYSHLDHHISELAADGAANPWLMSTAIVLMGLGIAALAPALLCVLPRRPAARVAAALFLGTGALMVVAGHFNLDCSTAVDATCRDRWDAGDADTAARIHAWSSSIAQLLFLGTPFALARALWNRPIAGPTLACGVAGLAIAIGTTVLFGIHHAPDGLTQRLGLAAWHAWVIVVAIGALRETGRAAEAAAS